MKMTGMGNRTYVRIAVPLIMALALVFSACRQEKYVYVQDVPRDEAMDITNNYTTTVFSGDRLYIYVASQMAAAALPFNEETNKKGRDIVSASGNEIKGYLVDEWGDIDFPLIGKVHVAGMTLDDVARDMKARLVSGGYVKDPVVTVKLMNFRVTVIGEVKKPQMLHGDGNRMTIFEALARCGDVTMDGIRTCVTVLHQGENVVTADTLDLTSKSVFDSPSYYLHSGDIVYVEPNKKKKRRAYRNDDIPSYISMGVQSVRLAYIVLLRYYLTNRYTNPL